jgi:4-amino-4-deoxy-L-arabinose transferase-like glycosyltransferase
VTESSLHCPPVYRRFLSGGDAQWRLSLRSAALVVSGGATLSLVGLASASCRGPVDWTAGLISAAAVVLTAWLVAGFAARWLGNRTGAVAGLVYLTSLDVIVPSRLAVADTLFCAAACAAMTVFAFARVPGRLPLGDRRRTAWLFYAALGVSFVFAGPTGPACILAGCLLFLLFSFDTRGLRFLLHPAGIALFVLLVAGWWWSVGLVDPGLASGTRSGGWSPAGEGPGRWPSLVDELRSLAVAVLPWTPLVGLAAVSGLRQGHYATPIGRFLACWVLAPLGMAALGLIGQRLLVAALLPPLAVIGSAGLLELLAWCRRRCPLLRKS